MARDLGGGLGLRPPRERPHDGGRGRFTRAVPRMKQPRPTPDVDRLQGEKKPVSRADALSGKTVCVVGGTTGIGRAVAALAAEIAITGRSGVEPGRLSPASGRPSPGGISAIARDGTFQDGHRRRPGAGVPGVRGPRQTANDPGPLPGRRAPAAFAPPWVFPVAHAPSGRVFATRPPRLGARTAPSARASARRCRAPTRRSRP